MEMVTYCLLSVVSFVEKMYILINLEIIYQRLYKLGPVLKLCEREISADNEFRISSLVEIIYSIDQIQNTAHGKNEGLSRLDFYWSNFCTSCLLSQLTVAIL